MSESVIPQKRPIDGEKTHFPLPIPQPQAPPTHSYLTRAKTEAETSTSTTPTQKKPITLNRFAPIIAYKDSDFYPEDRFSNTDDVPLNTRRGFQYSPCAPCPQLPVLKFCSTDAPPYRAAMSIFDRSASTELVNERTAVTTAQGWVSCRANVGISEGKVFFEFVVRESDANKHVRLGLSRREASIEAPVGYDGFGYGLRDIMGNTLHLSRPREFPALSEGFKSGDVIGVLVELPKEEKFQNIVREQIAIRVRQKAFFEKLDYTPSKEMDHLLNPVTVFGEKAVPDTKKYKPQCIPESKVTIYKNGELIGVAFEDLYDFHPPNSELKTDHPDSKWSNNGTLGYYPTISVYREGLAELNPGPTFLYKPLDLPQETKTLHEVYDSKIADDIVWDIIDEIEAESISDPSFVSFL